MENKIKNYIGIIVAIPFLLLLIPVSPNSNWINLHNAKKINFFENTAVSSIALHADEIIPLGKYFLLRKTIDHILNTQGCLSNEVDGNTLLKFRNPLDITDNSNFCYSYQSKLLTNPEIFTNDEIKNLQEDVVIKKTILTEELEKHQLNEVEYFSYFGHIKLADLENPKILDYTYPKPLT